MMNCKFCKADCVRSGEDRELEKRNCYKPMTNGDRIRAMSDEELADFLCNNTECGSCKFGHWTGCNVRDWLKQEAEK